ncbi:MAG: hypothetical protein JWP97_6231 [Labilithrix sp.]|nr:hypothetical protein [Labilithrix sp.]
MEPAAIRDAAVETILDVTPPDATPSIDASPACPGTFCDDFDEAGALESWDSRELAGAGALDIVTANVVSPPNAVRATLVETADQGPNHVAFLHKKLPRGKAIACEVDVKVVTAPNDRWLDVLRFETKGPGIAKYWLWWGVRPDLAGMFREDFFKPDNSCECPRQDLTPSRLEIGRWTHIKMVTDFATARIEQDGVTVAAGTFGGFAPDDDIDVSLGGFSAGYVKGVVELDNLVCTVTPL